MIRQRVVIVVTGSSKRIWNTEPRTSPNIRKSFVSLVCGTVEKYIFWSGKNFAFLKMEERGKEEKVEFAIVQYLKSSTSSDSLEKALRCVSLQWRTDDDTDLALAKISRISGEGSLKAEDGFGVERICSMQWTIHVQRENYVSSPFSDGKAWLLDAFI